MSNIQYRFMQQGEESKVCTLVELVFNEFVAPDFGQDGVDEFFRFANPEAMAGRASPEQVIVVAEIGREIIGIIEMIRYSHISLLFVSHRGHGIAKELIRKAIEESRRRRPDLKIIDVNSSTFAEPIYARMGFKKTGPKQEKNGIIFVPMALHIG